MDSSQFLEEVKNNELSPKNFEVIYEEFQQFQKLAMETLKEFHRVCEKNEIKYQLAYGSLLGAVRDKGQIPWDYDVDVFIFVNEKDKLIKALKKDLNKNFYFYCPELDEKCSHFFIRLAPIGYTTEILHVDVFYLIGAPEEDKKRINFTKKIKDLSLKRSKKLIPITDKSLKVYLVNFLNKLKLLNYDYNRDYMQYLECCNLYPIENSNICVTGGSYGEYYEFNYDILLETKLIETSIGEFRIPVNYDNILKTIYGDYKNVIPLKERINEVMHNYKRLKKYAKILNRDSK